ncbi:XRE family transcriptional regulator [Pseudomonas cavernae]|uniref:XRE family transcriptional regulator n=1 Tax=Pseudomonas cavernae TaxID=2320867 RepID=A0A385Z1N0_9PSED|nr:helix-turn-helix transcriptional regulator [Pseudomonas cavernae]AYC32986.1 XRE family transcriptional regulator [Pseudomonas cavernae]
MGQVLKPAIGEAIRIFRSARKHSQEGLGPSQSYISTLEKGRTRNATLIKIDQIGETLDVHPLSILAAAYRLANPEVSLRELFERIERELSEVDI